MQLARVHSVGMLNLGCLGFAHVLEEFGRRRARHYFLQLVADALGEYSVLVAPTLIDLLHVAIARRWSLCGRHAPILVFLT